jgi:maltose alpha-D-glucosyltransferase/alpha-amylase
VAERDVRPRRAEADPLWFKDAVIYELHVRAFFDSDGNGIGDFRGLTQKLDYLQDLGVTTLWLLPFYPSPLKDDGYDIADYTDVHPNYGTLRDVEVLLREAHRRGLRVITELVLNHTSDQHPWFQRARRAPAGSSKRNFYVWSDTPTRYAEARIIFKDFEASNWTWDPVAKSYYWHRFYSHQPDLNYENPAVRKAVTQALDFWARLGVDGFRLDAVPYLYEREGTNCENLPETHVFLKQLRRHMREQYPDRMFLAEANQWPEDAAAYFGNGDECDMAFHFPLMPRLFMGMHMEDRFPIVDILSQTPAIPENCQWALFLRNHDELTLEMVTDEERDYMYRVYAQDRQARINLGIRRRLAPLVGNHRRRIELLNGLLFSLPGTPVVYYGDELGMGDNIYLGDRNGVRTPMQWSADRNAGFSRANEQRLYLPVVVAPEYHPEAVNVEQQQQNPHSMLWWMKRLTVLRKRHPAFGRGTVEMLYPENRKVLAFVRSYGNERILVVANLSRFVLYAELDLTPYRGMVPTELFGGTEFPRIGEQPYFITLGPHSFYWFSLDQPRAAEVAPSGDQALPELTVEETWEEIFGPRVRSALEWILAGYLGRCRWFGGKARKVRSATVAETFRIEYGERAAHVVMLRVGYAEGEPETYAVPLTQVDAQAARVLADRAPGSLVARVRCAGGEGVLVDALAERGFEEALLEAIERRRRFRNALGELEGWRGPAFRRLRSAGPEALEPSLLRAEQSNTCIVYGQQLVLKFFRRVQEGTNPDLEIGRVLTARGSVAHTPPVAGALTIERESAESTTLAILHGYVANQGDAWSYTLGAVEQYFERVLTRRNGIAAPAPGPLLGYAEQPVPAPVHDTVGAAYLESARLLGLRSAELHRALASVPEPDFAPEPFTTLYQRSIYQSMRARARQTLELLRGRRRAIPEAARADAERVLTLEPEVDRRLRTVLARRLNAVQIRCHGDYHLGQVLWTGKDFVIIDFEGEPERSLSERRLKRAPLRDVAGMARSFHYAVYSGLAGARARGIDGAALEPAARAWYVWVAATFLRAYLDAAGDLVPKSRPEQQLLLDVFMLDKALYELGYELGSRPDWVGVPLRGIVEILESPPLEA